MSAIHMSSPTVLSPAPQHTTQMTRREGARETKQAKAAAAKPTSRVEDLKAQSVAQNFRVPTPLPVVQPKGATDRPSVALRLPPNQPHAISVAQPPTPPAVSLPTRARATNRVSEGVPSAPPGEPILQADAPAGAHEADSADDSASHASREDTSSRGSANPSADASAAPTAGTSDAGSTDTDIQPPQERRPSQAPAGDAPAPTDIEPTAADYAKMPLHERRSARAVLAGALVASASVMGASLAASRFLLGLGAPTPLTAVSLGVLVLVSYIPSQGLWRAPLQMGVTGVFLAVQVAGFATTAMPTILATWSVGVGIGLLPTALQAVSIASLNDKGSALHASLAAFRKKCGIGLLLPSVSMALLFFLNAWTLALPVLYIAAHAAHALILQESARIAAETLGRERSAALAKKCKSEEEAHATLVEDNRLNHIAPPPPLRKLKSKTWLEVAQQRGYGISRIDWPSLAEIGSAASAVNFPIGLLGVTAGCVAGTPWRYWWTSMKQTTKQMAGLAGHGSSGIAHEGVPMAFTQAAPRVA